jgi:hypothetical protein
MTRVPWSDLTETDPHAEWLAGVERNDAPFTGVAYALHPDGTLAGETPYLEGCMHGHSVAFHSNGRLSRDTTMRHARFVGDNLAWWPEGTLRLHRLCGQHPVYREWRWNRAGVLIAQRDDEAGESRLWYDDGTLRSERLDAVTRAFATDGALLWTSRTPEKGELATVTYDDDAMERHLDDLLVDPDVWHAAYGYALDLVRRDRPRALALIRRVLAGPNDLAKVDLMRYAAERGIVELVPDIEGFVSETTIPAPQRAGNGTRSSTRSIGESARHAVATFWARRK